MMMMMMILMMMIIIMSTSVLGKNSRRNIMAFRPLHILDGKGESDLSRPTVLSLLKYRTEYHNTALLTTALEDCTGHRQTVRKQSYVEERNTSCSDAQSQ